MARLFVRAALAGLLVLAGPGAAGADPLRMPAVHAAAGMAAAAIRAGGYAEAEAAIDALIVRVPGVAELHVLRAMARAGLGRAAETAADLQQAASLGFGGAAALLANPVFAGVAGDPRVAAAAAAPVAAVAPPPVAQARDGALPVTAEVLRWSFENGLYDLGVAFAPRPSVDRGPITRRSDGPVAETLAALRRRGGAAGLSGVIYDNRDRAHSRLRTENWPQLAATSYGEAVRRAGLDYGLNDRLRFGAPVIGNSSTAISTPAIARSLPRHGLTAPGTPGRLHALYAANHLYVYPEHRDHDPERGDLFPAAAPFFVVSQGSSGSDLPFLEAMAAGTAALRPDVRAAAEARGLIAPTLQMLLRRSLVVDDAAYLEGAAHPSAFDGGRLKSSAVAALAAALTVETLPPMALLAVMEEPAPRPGIEIFGDGLGEALFDTPSAAARVAQGAAMTRRYVLEAVAPPGEPTPARIVWRLLRGDPALVRIEPLDDASRRVAVTIDWHERRPAPGAPDLTTDRVDVGLFVGAAEGPLSAPAFFSLHFPPRQARAESAGAKALTVDYAAAARGDRYEDRVIVPHRPWRDVYARDVDGALAGWTRTRTDGTEADYTRDGLRVLTRDAQGRPLEAERVAYPVRRDGDGLLTVGEVETGEVLRYAYDGPADRRGVAMRSAQVR